MLKIYIAIISLAACALLLLIFLSQQGIIHKPDKNLPPQTIPQETLVPPETTTPPETTATIPTDTTAVPETATYVIEPPMTTVSETVAEETNAPETETMTMSETPESQTSVSPETTPATESEPIPEPEQEIISSSDYTDSNGNRWHYDLYSIEIGNGLPEGISLSDAFDAYGNVGTAAFIWNRTFTTMAGLFPILK